MSKGSSATVTQSVRNAKKRLTRLIKQCQEVPVRVLESEADRIASEAKAEAPLKTGKLENSIRVRVSKSVTRPGLNISASARAKNGYNYAGIQHENIYYYHPIKGKAHYLSDPFHRGVNRIERELSRRIKY